MRKSKKERSYLVDVVLQVMRHAGTVRTARTDGATILNMLIGKDKNYSKGLKGIRKSRI